MRNAPLLCLVLCLPLLWRPEPKEMAKPVLVPRALAKPEKPEKASLPDYLTPIGPKNARLYPQLVRLQGKSFREVQRQRGATLAFPPSYFARGRVMGFASVNGKAIPHYSLQSRRYTLNRTEWANRIQVLIARDPTPEGPNFLQIDNNVLRATAKKLGSRTITGRVIRYLVSLDRFDTCTMHLNWCNQPEAARLRSGIIASRRGLKPFLLDSYPATFSQVCRFTGDSGDKSIVFGDGGDTLAWWVKRDPKLGMLLLRWPEEQAKPPHRLDGST